MRQECIDAVRAAGIAKLNRTVNQQELRGIEDRIRGAMKDIARDDPQAWQQMTTEQRMRAAADKAATELEGEAIKKRLRVADTIKAHDTIENYMANQKRKYGWDAARSLQNVLENINTGKQDFLSLEGRTAAITKQTLGRMVDMYDAIGPRLWGMIANTEGQRAVLYELYGRDSSAITKPETAQLAKKAAQAWNEGAENLRQRFNYGGGMIGKLEDWRLPQSHSQSLVAKAGFDAWYKNIFTKLDRSKYVNLDGTPMNDDQMTTLLRQSFQSIATGGANKIEPGKFTGSGMLANRYREERVLHFKGPDEQIAYMQQFGNADLYSAMVRHVQRMGREIGRIETFGPNADLQFRYWLDTARKEGMLKEPEKLGEVARKMTYLQNTYNELSGVGEPVGSQRVANGFSTLRNWMTSTKLGKAFISAWSHAVPFRLQAWANGLSQLELTKYVTEFGNPFGHEKERIANLAGLGLDTMIGEVNRWSQDALGSAFSAKMANATVRLSGLNALNEARQKGFGVTMMGALSHAVENSDTLEGAMGHFNAVRNYGVTPDDFRVWKLAEPEDWGKAKMLTPESIYRIPNEKLPGNARLLKDQAATRLVAIISNEADMAVNKPNSYTRGLGGLRSSLAQRGTLSGEMWRQFMLFKTYPMGIIANQWMRGANMPTAGGKAMYIASLVAGMTLLGAVQEQAKQILMGKTPEPADPAFAAKAFMKGGSFGMYGDFLNELTTGGDGRASDLILRSMGLSDFVPLAQDADKFMKNKPTRVGEHLIELTRNNVPGNNIWYSQTVLNRLIFDQMLEMTAPGYASRMEENAIKHDQDYWWRPTELTPH